MSGWLGTAGSDGPSARLPKQFTKPAPPPTYPAQLRPSIRGRVRPSGSQCSGQHTRRHARSRGTARRLLSPQLESGSTGNRSKGRPPVGASPAGQSCARRTLDSTRNAVVFVSHKTGRFRASPSNPVILPHRTPSSTPAAHQRLHASEPSNRAAVRIAGTTDASFHGMGACKYIVCAPARQSGYARHRSRPPPPNEEDSMRSARADRHPAPRTANHATLPTWFAVPPYRRPRPSRSVLHHCRSSRVRLVRPQLSVVQPNAPTRRTAV
jgi:hypothetical protein